MTPGDPIAGYLAQFRAGLRATPREAELVVAEAEDHLRETAAAGMAIGMTELQAQEAAISSFGSVRAMIRAHQANRGRAAAVLGGAGLAAWKLISILLLTGGASGLVTTAYFRLSRNPLAFIWRGVPLIWLNPNVRLVWWWSAMVVIGAALLAGYDLARRRQRRRVRREPALARFSPGVAASFFMAVALALLFLDVAPAGVLVDPGLLVVACLALAVGYGTSMVRKLLRQG